MKKIFLTLLILSVVSFAYAADNKQLAEVIASGDGSTVLEVEQNNFKVKDTVSIIPAGNVDGVVTEVNENMVTISINNNPFAVGSKLLVKNSKRAGNAGAKKAEVAATITNGIVLDIKDNTFNAYDKVLLSADGDSRATVKSIDKNVVTLSSDNLGYAEGSKIYLTKKGEKFKEKRKN